MTANSGYWRSQRRPLREVMRSSSCSIKAMARTPSHFTSKSHSAPRGGYQAGAGTVPGLLPVLDAIDQARDHGELSGGFKSVADSLQSATSRLGLVTYGDGRGPPGPKIHEA